MCHEMKERKKEHKDHHYHYQGRCAERANLIWAEIYLRGLLVIQIAKKLKILLSFYILCSFQSRTAGTLPLYQAYLGVPGAPQGLEQERQRDPYAIPRREDSTRRRQSRVLLSQDPLIRVMMDERIDANYRSMSQGNIHTLSPPHQQQQRRLSAAQLVRYY